MRVYPIFALVIFLLIPLTFAGGWVIPSGIQSSCGNDIGYAATKIIDSSLTSNWRHSSTENHWVIVSFGSNYSISSIEAYTDPDSTKEVCGMNGVYVCDDSACSGESNLNSSCTFSGTSLGWYNCTFTNTYGTYAKISLQVYNGSACVASWVLGGSGNDGLYEVLLFKTSGLTLTPNETSPYYNGRNTSNILRSVSPYANVSFSASAFTYETGGLDTGIFSENSNGTWANHSIDCSGLSSCDLNYTLQAGYCGQDFSYYFWTNTTTGTETNTSTYSVGVMNYQTLGNESILSDTMINQSSPDSNYGTSPILKCNYGFPSDQEKIYSLWNYSSFGGTHLKGATAYFSLSGTSGGCFWNIYTIENKSWDENEVTWNNPILGTESDAVSSQLETVIGLSSNLTLDAYNITNSLFVSGYRNITYRVARSCGGTGSGSIFDRGNALYGGGVYSPNIAVGYCSIVYPQWQNNLTSSPIKYDPSINSTFSINWTIGAGSSINTVLFESNYSGNATNYTMTQNGTVWSYSILLPAGVFYWKSYANNSQGDWNSTDSWNFSIAKNDSVLLALSNNLSWNGTYPINSSTCGMGCVSGLNCSLYRNGTLIQSGNNSCDNQTLGSGSYGYIYNFTDTQNYTNYQETNTLTILLNSSILLNISNNLSWVGMYPVNSSTCVSGCPSGVNCTFYRNGTVISDICENMTLSAGIWNYSYQMNNLNYTNYFINNTLNISKNDSNGVTLILIYNSTSYPNQNLTVKSDEVVGMSCQLNYNQSGACKIYIDGVEVVSGTNNTYGVGNHSIVANTSGNENYTNCSTLTYQLTSTSTTTVIYSATGGGSGSSSSVCGDGVCQNPETQDSCFADCANVSFTLAPEKLSLDGYAGSSVLCLYSPVSSRCIVRVYNPSNQTLTVRVNVSSSDEAVDWLTLYPKLYFSKDSRNGSTNKLNNLTMGSSLEFNLSGGTENWVVYDLAIPGNSTIGQYQVNMDFASGVFYRTLPIKLTIKKSNVLDIDYLFDQSLRYSAESISIGRIGQWMIELPGWSILFVGGSAILFALVFVSNHLWKILKRVKIL